MSVEVTCTNCGKRLRSSDKYAGWRVQCPQCNAMNQFPAMGEALADTNDTPPRSKTPGPSGETPIQAKPLPAPGPPPAESTPAPAGDQNPTPADSRRCAVCDRPVFANDMVGDTRGKVYHRGCYDREQSRRAAAAARQQPGPSRPQQIPPPPSPPGPPAQAKPASKAAAPQRPAPPASAWVPPTTPSRSKSSRPSTPSTRSTPAVPPDEILDGSLLTPLPSESTPDGGLADSGALLPLPEPLDSVAPADDLWGSVPLPGATADPFGPSPVVYEPAARLSRGMYVLIGIGGAMPVLAILAMVIYSFTRQTNAPPVPMPAAAQAPASPGAPGPVPMASSQPLPPGQPSGLSEARRGFRTKLVRQESARQSAPPPPPTMFRLVRYESPAGQLAAYLSPSPQDGKKHPVIIWITGGDCNTIDDGPWNEGPPENDQSASAFRKAGILMMYPSLRGGNDNPGYKEGFFGEVDDVLAARDYLAKQDFVDPGRIYLGGHSTGGTLALLAAESSGGFRAVFSFGPVEDVAGYGNEFLFFDRSIRRESELRAPILWLSSVRSPTFVFEGSRQPGNFSSLQSLARASSNPQLHFHAVPNKDHFSALAPTTQLIATKILRDEGPATNITFAPEFAEIPGRAPTGTLAANPPDRVPSGAPSSPRTSPGPAPWAAPTPSPRVSNTAQAEAIGFAIGFVVAVVGIPLVIGTLIGAIVLRVACSGCSVKVPPFGKAMLVSFVASLIDVVVSIPIDLALGAALGRWVALAVCFLVNAFVYSRLLRVSFGTGIGICVVIFLIWFAIGVALVILALALAFLLPGLQALRRG